MGHILCWLGRHRRKYGWSKAYNLQTGYLRYYHECRRCGVEMPEQPRTPIA